jgi:Zn-finger protein
MLGSYQFFENRACKFYPCHKGLKGINCLFCYCPLYPYDDCGGDYTYTSGCKDCSNCILPHTEEGYFYVINFLSGKGAKRE